MRRLLLSTSALLALTSVSYADVVVGGQNWTGTGDVLTLSAAVPPGNQPLNTPCVICGDNQPQQPANFGYNDFHNSGGVSNYAMFSTATIGGSLANDQIGTGYNVSFLDSFLASQNASLAFTIGIDINDTSQAQILESFLFLNLTTHMILASFSPGPGGVAVPSLNNGTGFPDYTLSGFTLDGVNPGDQVLFYARWSNANDGPESFFLTPQVNPVPGPILGAGFPGLLAGALGLWALARKRRERLA